MAGGAQADGDGGDDGLISTINVTPLVDIFLVLLVIFMVTASFFLEEERRLREIPLTLPTAFSGQVPVDKAAPISVLLDRLGRVWLDGRVVELDAVGRAVDARVAAGSLPQAVVSADKDLPFGRVARVVDYLKLHGVSNLAINVEEQTIEP
jgi:biopolymer transport protein ExbD